MIELLMHWLQTNSGIAYVGSWILGLSAVGVFIHKYSPVVRKYIHLTREGLDVIDALLDAIQYDKITQQEIENLIKLVNEFKADLK